MMTKREFYKSNDSKAFEIAAKQHVWNPEISYNVQLISAQAQLILDEWFDDYKAEHV